MPRKANDGQRQHAEIVDQLRVSNKSLESDNQEYEAMKSDGMSWRRGLAAFPARAAVRGCCIAEFLLLFHFALFFFIFLLIRSPGIDTGNLGHALFSTYTS